VDRQGLLAVLEHDGVLLLSDAVLPSIASLVAGGRLRGSWWGHPRGGEIYRLLNQVADDDDVLMAKLIAGKVTFVHRRLWPAIVAVGQAREAWQMDKLSPSALVLLGMLDETGRLAWDDVPPFLPPAGGAARDTVREVERRLLVHTAEVHTESGAHARNLQTWPAWAACKGLTPPFPDAAEARAQVDALVSGLNERYGAAARLPWQTRPGARPRGPARLAGARPSRLPGVEPADHVADQA
jgi:hypothetical protein